MPSLFVFKTKTRFCSYLNMIRLIPTSEEQSIVILPRNILEDALLDYNSELNWDLANQTWNTETGEVSLTITEEGTGIKEELSGLVFEELEKGVKIYFASSILKLQTTYYLEFRNGSYIWYRANAFATNENNKLDVYTLNEGKYKQYDVSTDDEYIVL